MLYLITMSSTLVDASSVGHNLMTASYFHVSVASVRSTNDVLSLLTILVGLDMAMGCCCVLTFRGGDLRSQKTLYDSTRHCVYSIPVIDCVMNKNHGSTDVPTCRLFTAAMIICDLVNAGVYWIESVFLVLMVRE